MTRYQYASPWDFREHQRALRAVSAVTLRRRPWFWAFRITFPFFLAALVFGSQWLSEGFELNTIFFMGALPWLLLILVWMIFLRWGESYLATRRTRRLDPSAAGTLTRTFTPDGFRIDGTGVSVDLRWHGIHSVVETREFLLVFHNKLCGYYVPKRLIVAPHQLDAVRDLIRANLGERAQLAPARSDGAT